MIDKMCKVDDPKYPENTQKDQEVSRTSRAHTHSNTLLARVRGYINAAQILTLEYYYTDIKRLYSNLRSNLLLSNPIR